MSAEPQEQKQGLLKSPVARLIIEVTPLVTAIAAILGVLNQLWSQRNVASQEVGMPVALLAVSAVGLGWYVFAQRRKQQRAFADIAFLREQAASAKEEHRRVETTCRELSLKLKACGENEIRPIHPRQYLQILSQLTEKHGRGNLLLFNVELNSFVDNDMFGSLWRRLAELPELERVKLALPPTKFERWETLVTGDRADFFGDPRNGAKFVACRYEEDRDHGRDRIAFALYETSPTGRLADWAAVFFINRPFAVRRPGGIYDYLHILEYNGRHDQVALCHMLWTKVYSSNEAEPATLILKTDFRLKGHTDLEELIREHACNKRRADDLRRIVGGRRVVEPVAMHPAPQELCERRPPEDGRYRFRLTYAHEGPVRPDEAETIGGWVVGIPRDGDSAPRPCLIWATGFGDGNEPDLARLLSRMIRSEELGIAETFYAKSGPIEETTCSRLSEDLKSVLDYVDDIPRIDRKRICIVGISICGFLAARLAQQEPSVGGLILVAPPFDVVEMLDNLRRYRYEEVGRDGQPPAFEDFLKAKNNQRLADWDEDPDWCTYFNQHVRGSHLADIAVQGPGEFRREAFFQALREITTGGRPVALVYGADDPVVSPAINITELETELEAGHIRREFMELREIPVCHFYPSSKQGRRYPMRFQDSRRILRDMASAIKHCLRVVIDEKLIERCADEEDQHPTIIRLGKTG